MQNVWILVAVAAAALIGWWVWQSQEPAAGQAPPMDAISKPASEGPLITGIDFPAQFNADGEYVKGVVHFQTAGSDLVHAQFDVVAAAFFVPFGFDPQVAGVTQGQFEFYLATVIPQQVTLQVTLTDAQGHASRPQEFSFTAVQIQDLLQGESN